MALGWPCPWPLSCESIGMLRADSGPFCSLKEKWRGARPSLLPAPASVYLTINIFHDRSKKEARDCPRRSSINHRTVNDLTAVCWKHNPTMQTLVLIFC